MNAGVDTGDSSEALCFDLLHLLDHPKSLLSTPRPLCDRPRVSPRARALPPTQHVRVPYETAGGPACAPRLTRLMIIDVLMDYGLGTYGVMHTGRTYARGALVLPRSTLYLGPVRGRATFRPGAFR